jgi:hypothetical protein
LSPEKIRQFVEHSGTPREEEGRPRTIYRSGKQLLVNAQMSMVS